MYLGFLLDSRGTLSGGCVHALGTGKSHSHAFVSQFSAIPRLKVELHTSMQFPHQHSCIFKDFSVYSLQNTLCCVLNRFSYQYLQCLLSFKPAFESFKLENYDSRGFPKSRLQQTRCMKRFAFAFNSSQLLRASNANIITDRWAQFIVHFLNIEILIIHNATHFKTPTHTVSVQLTVVYCLLPIDSKTV